MPIYEYECLDCGARFETIEKFSDKNWKAQKKIAVYCKACGKKRAFRVVSRFKIGSKALDTTGKSGYETEDFTLGKLIDEGGIPYEERNRLRNREDMINRQKKYTEGLRERSRKYEFNPFGDADDSQPS